jgi:hypothetical protein
VCAGETRAPEFRVGLAARGDVVAVSVVSASPLPPTAGTNTWTLHAASLAGEAIDGARVVVTPFMPDHGHGSPLSPTVRGVGGGDYRVSNLSFSMPGYWEARVKVTLDGATPDAAPSLDEQVVLKICVDLR